MMIFIISVLCLTIVVLSSTSPIDPSFESNQSQTSVTLEQAIAIIEKRHLTQCVARCICELSCNPNSYGTKGTNVYKTLKQFESDTLPKLSFFKEASSRGRTLQSNCKQCYDIYPNCKTQTETLLRLASALSIK